MSVISFYIVQLTENRSQEVVSQQQQETAFQNQATKKMLLFQ